MAFFIPQLIALCLSFHLEAQAADSENANAVQECYAKFLLEVGRAVPKSNNPLSAPGTGSPAIEGERLVTSCARELRKAAKLVELSLVSTLNSAPAPLAADPKRLPEFTRKEREEFFQNLSIQLRDAEEQILKVGRAASFSWPDATDRFASVGEQLDPETRKNIQNKISLLDPKDQKEAELLKSVRTTITQCTQNEMAAKKVSRNEPGKKYSGALFDLHAAYTTGSFQTALDPRRSSSGFEKCIKQAVLPKLSSRIVRLREILSTETKRDAEIVSASSPNR